jgi:hypothetical protein
MVSNNRVQNMDSSESAVLYERLDFIQQIQNLAKTIIVTCLILIIKSMEFNQSLSRVSAGGDTWRDVQLLNSTKLLPIPFGYAQRTTDGPMNTRFGLL